MKATQLSLFDSAAAPKLSRDRVWYGFTKLTKKAVRKRELAIFFENCGGGSDEWVAKHIYVAYVRRQTQVEATDGKLYSRSYAKYGYLIDEKPYCGDIEQVLLANYNAESNHVSEAEREKIRAALRQKYEEISSIYEQTQRPKR